MKIIHTADWHLGDHLHRLDRTGDLRKRVVEVARICEEQTADVLVIAGDLFSNHSLFGIDDMTRELEHIQGVFAPFFRRGGTILAVTGNHDLDKPIEFIRAGMRLAAIPHAGGQPLTPGRMYLQNGPGIAVLEAGGERVQFVLVPYPYAHRYADPDDDFKSPAERNRVTSARVASWVQKATEKPGFDQALPSVLVAHLHIRGSEIHSLYKATETDEAMFGADFIPSHWAYVALGHIHKPQALGGNDHIRYPGPLDRLDFGERHDDRGVIALSIGKKHGPACRTAPEWVPIAPTPMHIIRIGDTDELDALPKRFPDCAEAIVKITVALKPDGPSRDEVMRRLRKTFPRFAEIDFDRAEVPSDDTRCAGIPAGVDYRETVRRYLADRSNNSDLLALAETFLSPTETAS